MLILWVDGASVRAQQSPVISSFCNGGELQPFIGAAEGCPALEHLVSSSFLTSQMFPSYDRSAIPVVSHDGPDEPNFRDV